MPDSAFPRANSTGAQAVNTFKKFILAFSLIATLAFFAGGLLATHVLWPLLLGAA